VRHNEQAPTSPRVIGPISGFAIVAGSMLGIGIFLSPSIVAAHVNSPAAFLALWALGGLTALAGAVACGELGTMMPRAGGDYVFQYEAWGPSVAFASGWVLFAAIFCGSIATLAVGVCQYQIAGITGIDMSRSVVSVPWGEVTRAQCVALALVPLLTGINALGAHLSARTQTMLTLLPVGSLTLMALYALLFGGDVAEHAATAGSSPVEMSLGGLVLAYMSIYFAYSGWINVVYVAGEVRDPGRNIPRALIGGTVAITALYLLLCSGFLRVLGLDTIRTAGEVGTATAAVVAGDVGRLAITLLVAVALTACINASILGGARVAYAMALGGAIWAGLGKLGTKHPVPYRALWIQALVAGGLIVSGTFEQLLSMVSLAMVVTGTLTVSSVFALRRNRPDWLRPYRATLYPFLPAFYVASSVAVVAVMVHRAFSNEPGAWYPLFGLGILIVAFVMHRAIRGTSVAMTVDEVPRNLP
jgi:basic amino acid/polyamine antiporter, APA family